MQADYFWIVLSMLCAVLSHFVRAIRWNRLIRTLGYKTSSMQTFYAVMTGYLTNLAIPRMGEITRCITLSKASKIPVNALAGTVVAERVFDLISLAFIVLMTIMLQFNFLKGFLFHTFWNPIIERSTENRIPIAIVTSATILFLVFLFVFFQKKLTDPRDGSYYFRLKRQYHGFMNGIKTIKRMQGKGWFMLHSFLIWGLYYLTVYLCFFALTPTSHLTPIVGLTLLTVGSLGILAPVPGGIGTYHFMTIITLTELYDIGAEPAASYAYITHATQIVVNVIAGAASWFILSVNSKKLMG